MERFSDIQAWTIFVNLYDTRCVQQTASELKLSPSIVSRKLASLEKTLGVELFDRSVRPMRITEESERIIAYAKEILYQQKKISQYLKERQDDSTQIIRVMLGNSFSPFAPQLINEYLTIFPSLRFNMISPMDVEDFKAGKADIINVSEQHHLENCVLLPRSDALFLAVATPEYLEKHGAINHPCELAGHNLFSSMYKGRFSFLVDFNFVRDGDIFHYVGNQKVRWSNVEMAKQAILQHLGVGLCIQPEVCINELESGRLVPILNGWHRQKIHNYIAVKNSDWRIRSIRTFAQWWCKRIVEIEMDCQKRLVRLYGEEFLEILKS